MRFRQPVDSSHPTPPGPLSRRGPSLRLAAMLVALLLVFAAMARLRQPATHRAIGRVLGESAAVTAPPGEVDPLVPPTAFDAVRDNAPFRDDELRAWFSVLEALQKAEVAVLAGRSAGPVGYATLSSQPETYRGRVVTVAGSVQRVEPVTPAENDLGLTRLWRVTLKPAGGEVWPITVYTLQQPRDSTDPYDASAVGVFFKKLSYRWAGGVGVTPVVVARRLETTLASAPAFAAGEAADTVDEPPLDFAAPSDASLGRALLADLGVNLAALDAVADRTPLRAEDAAAFYGLLSAVEATPASQLNRLSRAGLSGYVDRKAKTLGDSLRDRQTLRALRTEQARDRYSVVPLFGEGSSERGELVTLDAVVRRAVRVDASGSDVATELGLDHYYELEAFSDDSQNLPIVFVMRDLPAGFPVGDAIRQPARLSGFFFKQWAYRTRKRAETDPGKDRRQFAPLLVGRAPIPLATPDAASARPGLAIGLLATAGLAGIAVAIWRLGYRDRAYESATLARFRRRSAADPLDFDHLEQLNETP